MNHRNLIDELLNDNLHSDEIRINAKIIVNALTSETINSVLSHLISKRRILPNIEPTLEARNEMDAQDIGDEVGAEIMENMGMAVNMKPIKIAELCDALRFNVYNELHRFTELPEAEEALTFAPKHNVEYVVNFDQPMSAEENIDFRIKMSAVPTETQIRTAAALTETPEDIVRGILQEAANRESNRLKDLKPEVLREIKSLDSVAGTEAFLVLPTTIQIKLGDKIAAGLNRLYKNRFTFAVRTGDLERLNELKLIKSTYEHTKKWLDQAEAKN
jgi:hypothetical protein